MGLSSYTSTSYSSAKLETQPSAMPGSGLKRLAGRRLPWGNTQKVVPEAFMRPEPETLRFWEKEYKRREHLKAEGTYKPKPMERIDFHDRCDHEHYRHAPWAKRSQFWLFLHPFGKVGFFLFLFLSIVVALLVTSLADADYLGAFAIAFKLMFTAFAVPCLAAWLLASLVIHQFPHLWAKPSKGPKWELNRSTGMITVFEYRRRQVNEKRAPFYEFDAYINTVPDRQGLTMHILSLEHRYSDISIHLGDIQPPDRNAQQPCALWDFIQNYMDTSHPLPDAPLFEEHRRNDPTTVEHDKATGRKERFWIDMSDVAFKQEQSLMRSRVDAVDTFSRRNLMAQHVDYPL